MLSYTVALTAGLSAAPCDAMKAVSLPGTTITVAELVPAGPCTSRPRPATDGTTGAHAACALPHRGDVFSPSADSQIEMELWLPIDAWNGKFQAVGNGGWAGAISFDQMAVALQRGYATASNDTGHKGEGTQFLIGHPERVIDFAYRAMHDMTVTSKALVAPPSTGTHRSCRITTVAQPADDRD